jgi:hypothetical protein
VRCCYLRRQAWLSPLVQVLIGLVAFLSAMVTTDRLYHFYTALYYKHVAKGRPEDKYSSTPLPRDMVSILC